MKSRINNLFDSFSYTHYILLSLVLIGFVSLLFYIFLTYPIIFHSDSAAHIALAKERMETFSIFPKDWCHSTGIMFINPSLFIPLFLPLCGYSILAKSCSVLLLVVLLFFLVSLLFSRDESKIGYFFALSLLFSGGSFFAEHMYGQASYLSGICMIMIVLLLTRKILEMECAVNFKYLVNLCILFVLTSLISFSGLSAIVWYILPFIASLVIIGFLDLMKDLRSDHHNKKDKLNQIVLICTWLFSLLTGSLCYWIFVSLKETGMGKTVGFVGVDLWAYNFGLLIDGLKFFSGATFAGIEHYFPFANILNVYRLLIFVILIFIIPFLLILRFNNIKKRFVKILILYHLITTITILSAFIFTNITIDVLSSRYLLFPFFLSFIIFGIFINEYFATRPKKVFFILIIFLPFFFTSWIQMNLPYGKIEIKEGKLKIQKNSSHYSGITEFLKSNELEYGYASFWNAGVISALSSWDVQVNPIITSDLGIPIPYYWLSSKGWYDSSYYKGKTFLLLSDREDMNFDFLKVFLGNTCRELRYPGYKIFVYDFNVADNLIGWPSFLPSNKYFEETLPEDFFKLCEDKELFFFVGWEDFVDRNGDVIQFTKNKSVTYIKTPGEDICLSIRGYIEVAEDSNIGGIRFYINDNLLDRFEVTENPTPFTNYYIIKADQLKGRKWAKLCVELEQPVLRDGSNTAEGLFVEEIEVSKIDSRIFYVNGWHRDLNKELRHVSGNTIAYFEKPRNDVFITIKAKPHIKSTNPSPKVIISINNEKIDEITFQGNLDTIIDRSYFVSKKLFENSEIPNMSINLENINAGKLNMPDVNKNHVDLMIGYSKGLDKDRIIFTRGWYYEEETQAGKIRYRWMQKKALCFLKVHKRDTILKVSGMTSIKHFSRPIKVKIYLSDKMIDEFLVKRNIFSRTININHDHECNKWQELVIKTDQTFIPDRVLHNGDRRELSLMISGIIPASIIN